MGTLRNLLVLATYNLRLQSLTSFRRCHKPWMACRHSRRKLSKAALGTLGILLRLVGAEVLNESMYLDIFIFGSFPSFSKLLTKSYQYQIIAIPNRSQKQRQSHYLSTAKSSKMYLPSSVIGFITAGFGLLASNAVLAAPHSSYSVSSTTTTTPTVNKSPNLKSLLIPPNPPAPFFHLPYLRY